MTVPDLGIGWEDFLMCVVDVLRHDIENLASTVKLLNNRGSIGWREFSGRDFTEGDVIRVLEELVRREMVRVLREDEGTHQLNPSYGMELDNRDIYSCWFELTPKARQAWDRWTPPQAPLLEDCMTDDCLKVFRAATERLGQPIECSNVYDPNVCSSGSTLNTAGRQS